LPAGRKGMRSNTGILLLVLHPSEVQRRAGLTQARAGGATFFVVARMSPPAAMRFTQA
jgi:hypothetical protein